MMLPVLQIGPLSIQTPGLLLLLAIWIGLNQSEKHATNYLVDPNTLYKLTMWVLGCGIIGARIAYIIRFPGAFSGNYLSAFSLSPDLLDVSGGILTGIITLLIFCQKKNINTWQVLDGLTPGLAILAIGLGLMNFASGSGYGTPSTFPWAIDLWGESRHPTQIYQMILAGFAAWAVWPSESQPLRWNKLPYQPGAAFLLFTALSSLANIFLEAFRGDSTMVFSTIRQDQVLYLITLAAALYFLNKIQLTKKEL